MVNSTMFASLDYTFRASMVTMHLQWAQTCGVQTQMQYTCTLYLICPVHGIVLKEHPRLCIVSSLRDKLQLKVVSLCLDVFKVKNCYML